MLNKEKCVRGTNLMENLEIEQAATALVRDMSLCSDRNKETKVIKDRIKQVKEYLVQAMQTRGIPFINIDESRIVLKELDKKPPVNDVLIGESFVQFMLAKGLLQSYTLEQVVATTEEFLACITNRRNAGVATVCDIQVTKQQKVKQTLQEAVRDMMNPG